MHRPRIVRIVTGLLTAGLLCCQAGWVVQDQGLVWASGIGHLEIVKFLLENGADANAKTDEDTTALMAASFMNHTEVVKLLMGEGAHIDAAEELGNTALTLASF